MPELVEVETVCRVIRRALQGKRITRVEVVPDPIIFGRVPPKAIEKALLGRTLNAVGRRGKFFWLILSGTGPTVYAHLGMSGWVRRLGPEGTRLHGHGDAPFDDENGRARFLKLGIASRSGSGIVLTDPRRLGRVWLGDSPELEARVQRLGRDAYDDLPSSRELLALFGRRKIPIKAVLLDQGALAGIGNVEVVEGPLEAGWAAGAPYDLIVIDGAVEQVPEALTEQGHPGARLVTGLVDRGVTRLALGERGINGFGLVDFADIGCTILPGFDRPRSFTF